MTTDSRSSDSGVTRRELLGAGVCLGVAGFAPAVGSATPQSATAPAAPALPASELDEITLADLHNKMATGELTAAYVAQKYVQRIEAIDRHGPQLRAIIELNPESIEIADRMDAERAAGKIRSRLHGMPVLIKDNIETGDKMSTSAGSLALQSVKAANDAFCIKRLREMGAVILGKTNLSEWANGRGSNSTSGWSARGGLTRNPYALDRCTSGSSSGSAVAVAANLCAAAVGTETDGSIVSPASVNGIVGIKPTVGRISRAGIIPLAHSQDTAGAMARTVRDAMILLDSMTEVDPADPITKEYSAHIMNLGRKMWEPNGLVGMRIGVLRKLFGFHRGVDAVMEEALRAITSAGATLIDPVEIDTLGKFNEAEMTVLTHEIKADLNAYLARLGPDAPVHSLKEVIEFNDANRDKELAYFGQEWFTKAEATTDLTAKEYLDALETCRRMTRKDGIDAVMDKHRLDALVAPTEAPAWLIDLVDGDHALGGSSSLAAVAGYPSVTVPAGFVAGLPVGISFFGRAWSETPLVRMAFAFEQTTQVRKPPQFLASAPIGAV